MSYYNQKQVNDITKSIKFSEELIEKVEQCVVILNKNDRYWFSYTFSKVVKEATEKFCCTILQEQGNTKSIK